MKKRKGVYADWAMYAALIIMILAYALTSSIFAGIAAFALVIIILLYEFRQSVRETGAKGTLVDMAKAIAIVVVVWIALVIVLQTLQPVNVVASCSMLPVLNRGDIVLLHGVGNLSSFLYSNHVPVINLSQGEFSRMYANMSSEFLSYFAYPDNSPSEIGYIGNVSSKGYRIGLYNTKCIDYYAYSAEPWNYARCMVPYSSQSNNLITYNYSVGRAVVNGAAENAVYTSMITIANHTVIENYSNPIIIYQATSADYFSGDIIHRLYAALKVGSRYYLLTKGDNNQGLDIEFGNYPINQSDLIGYEVASVPLVGYLKLIISGQLGSVAGCNQTLLR